LRLKQTKREQVQDVDKNLLCGLAHCLSFWASLKCEKTDMCEVADCSKLKSDGLK